MDSIETLATFFGWCTVINAGIVLLALSVFGVAHEWVGRMSAKVFGVTNEEAKVTLFCVFQQYRLALVVLNLVPYVTLKIMT